MKNIICIDLTQFNKEKLVEVADKYGLNIENLTENKEMGTSKIYFCTDLKRIIAFSNKGDKKVIFLSDGFEEILRSIEPVVMTKRSTGPLIVDNILDKIGKYGIESLSTDEKNFLDGKN